MITKTVVLIIEFYQRFLSFDGGLLRFFAPSGACRYPISCSQYCKEAILEHGLVKGGILGVTRVISCNPLVKVS